MPEDTLGDAYEYLIGRFADDGSHTAQEFYTNRTVVHVMTQMLEPQAGERIYDEIARERAYSFLRPEHQQRIADTYHAFADQPGFCRVASLAQIADNAHSLSIPLYVKRPTAETDKPEDQRTLREVWDDWAQDGRAFWQQMDALVETPDGLVAEQEVRGE